MTILAIETSCDETGASVIVDGVIKSNVVWSQIKLHAPWGGVVPSIAKRAHEERIDGIIKQALEEARVKQTDFVAVTVGPGLAIALEVGILKAKELSLKWGVGLIKINHLEGHILASAPESEVKSYLALIVSGGHTELVLVRKNGKYKIIAKTADDALGEALDKAAKMLGLGYPGGPVIEKMAKLGKIGSFDLPIPLRGREKEGRFSYSGLKTALLRLIEKIKENGDLDESTIQDLAASYQEACFEHLIRVVRVNTLPYLDAKKIKGLLVGGGVIINKRLQEKLEEMGKELRIKIYFPKERFCQLYR